MSRALDDLCPSFRHMACALIARCAERGVWLVIIDTLRTEKEQRENLKRGASKTMNSLHLPQKDCPLCGGYGGLSHAMDAAPIKELTTTNLVRAIQWDAKHPAWKVYGEEAQKLSLVWGGTWGWDHSHVQKPNTKYESKA